MIIGVLGGGQLARMLALAGYPLGQQFMFLSPDPSPCAAPLGEHLCAAYDDIGALQELAARVDVVTFEFENVPCQAARLLAQRVVVRPSVEALTLAQDRLLEKQLFQGLHIPAPPFVPVWCLADLERAVSRLGLPAVLKTRCQGYDGKGQAVLRRLEDIGRAWEECGEQPAILEPLVAFDREISIIGVRGHDGETLFYPLSENLHQAGVLRLSTVHPSDPLQARAEIYARRLLDRLNYVGVLALEFFQVGDRLLANEFAPRVHNSGHWTIEGAETSQFENHLRAVAGLPLGSVATKGLAGMVNFIGAIPPPAEVLKHPGVHLHAYGKSHRPGRKVGHATVLMHNRVALEHVSARLLALAGVADASGG
jgi:5-(carboxyamino)imidazole ribonucleotide synthase